MTKRMLNLVLAAVLLFTGGAAADGFRNPPGNGGQISGEVILRFAPNVDPDTILLGTGVTLADSIANLQMFLAEFSVTIPVDTMINRLQGRAGVLHVQPNMVHWLPEVLQMSQSFPDQNCPPYEAGVSPAPYYEQPAASSIGADSANIMAVGDDVVVALIDNGIALEHPLFVGALDSRMRDFVDDDDEPAEVEGDMYGHGTFAAGVVRLLAPESRLLPYRAFDGNGESNTFAICQAIYVAIDDSVDVINVSFGMSCAFPVLAEAVEAAIDAGIIVVAAAGNDGLPLPIYPASLENVISVGALDTLEHIAVFSNFGDSLDVCAPGVNIYSSLAGEYQWGTWSGTSFSAPIVSGVCALVLDRHPEVLPEEMHQHVQLSARTELLWGSITAPDIVFGYGCVDAFDAVLAYTHGDLNNSGTLNLADVSYLIRFVYLNGPPPVIATEQADVNCNGKINLADISALIAYVYLDGSHYCPCY